MNFDLLEKDKPFYFLVRHTSSLPFDVTGHKRSSKWDTDQIQQFESFIMLVKKVP